MGVNLSEFEELRKLQVDFRHGLIAQMTLDEIKAFYVLGAFDKMEQSKSLPCFRREFEDLTPIEMQRTLVAAFKAEQAFLRPRKRPTHLV